MTAAGTPRTRSFRATLASIASTLAGARDCAVAAESGRRPSDRSLRALGITGREWDDIGSR